MARKDDATRTAFLAECFGDFRLFCGLLHVLPKNGNKQRFALNDIQRLYCAARTPRDIVLKPRQIGFTTLEQARDVFLFVTRPGSRVVATCQSMQEQTPLRQLCATYRLMFDSLRAAGVPLDFTTENQAEWELGGRGSSLRIIQAGASRDSAEKKGRAGTVTRLHLTETAFYDHAAETLNALFECVPSVADGGEIVSESTPNGAVGVFYEQYQKAVNGENGFASHFYPWFLQTEYRTRLEAGEIIEPITDREIELVTRYGVTAEQIKWFREKVAQKGQDLTDQEYPTDAETCFLVTGRQFLDAGVTRRLLTQAFAPLHTKPIRRATAHGELRIFAEPKPGATYVLALDPSEGAGGDPGAGVLCERATGEHVATLSGQFPPYEFAAEGAKLATLYNGALIVVESNYQGVLQALDRELHYTNVYVGENGKPGWYNTEPRRAAALESFENAFRTGQATTRDKKILEECLSFVVKNGKAQAASGSHDDMVMAWVIAWDVMRVPIGLPGNAGGDPMVSRWDRQAASFDVVGQHGTQTQADRLVSGELARWAGGLVGGNVGFGNSGNSGGGNGMDGF